MTPSKLEQQLAFLREIDRLKGVMRLSPLIDGSRRENSGEHSWHLALYAMVLADQAAPGQAEAGVHDVIAPVIWDNGSANALTASDRTRRWASVTRS